MTPFSFSVSGVTSPAGAEVLLEVVEVDDRELLVLDVAEALLYREPAVDRRLAAFERRVDLSPGLLALRASTGGLSPAAPDAAGEPPLLFDGALRRPQLVQ